MASFTKTEIQEATGASVAVSGEKTLFSGVETDTRVIGRDALFVALKGERFDGHDFVGKAVQQARPALSCPKCGMNTESTALLFSSQTIR